MSEEQLGEEEIQFGVGQVDDFEQNLVWKEIVKTIKKRISINNGELRSKSDLNIILRAQGDLVACEFLLVQPELLRLAIEEQDADEKKRKEEEPEDE